MCEVGRERDVLDVEKHRRHKAKREELAVRIEELMPGFCGDSPENAEQVAAYNDLCKICEPRRKLHHTIRAIHERHRLYTDPEEWCVGDPVRAHRAAQDLIINAHAPAYDDLGCVDVTKSLDCSEQYGKRYFCEMRYESPRTVELPGGLQLYGRGPGEDFYYTKNPLREPTLFGNNINEGDNLERQHGIKSSEEITKMEYITGLLSAADSNRANSPSPGVFIGWSEEPNLAMDRQLLGATGDDMGPNTTA